jgi:type I restriction enzyme, S subunit
VHYKSSGEHPPGMDAETAALFPYSFEDSALGLIPSGWQAVCIGDHVKATKGLSYKGEYLVDSIEAGMPMHNLNSVNEWGTYKFDGIKFYSGEYQSRHEVKPGDLIVANTEQGFDLLLIASPAIVPATFGEMGLFSHHIYKVEVKPKSPLTRLFLYYRIMMSPFRDILQGYTNGTTVNMLPPDAFETPKFVMPSDQLMQRFDEIVAPMLAEIEANYEESRTLAETRDALLPKLVSGEIQMEAMR